MRAQRGAFRAVSRLLGGVAAVACVVWATGCGPSRAERERQEAEFRARIEQDDQEIGRKQEQEKGERERQAAELAAKEDAERQEADRLAA